MNAPGSLLLLAGILCGAGAVHAQQMTLSTNLASPGQVVTATLLNDSGGFLAASLTCETVVVRHSGELAELLPVGLFCDAVWGMSPGETRTFPVIAPTAPGSYNVVFAPVIGERVVVRLDVTAPTPGAQQIAFYPANFRHEVDFSVPSNWPWEFSNVGTTSFAFAANDRIDVTDPGGSTVLRTIGLGGLPIAPGRTRRAQLPITGLTPGPYTVSAWITDPATGTQVNTRSGIQVRNAFVDLHRMGPREIAPGETTEFGVVLNGLPTPADQDPTFFLMLGGLPGQTPLPGGLTLPLRLDGLAIASLNGAIPGLANNTGTLPNELGAGSLLGYFAKTRGITMTHPAIPAASGQTLRVAVLAVDAQFFTWGASQPEELVLL